MLSPLMIARPAAARTAGPHDDTSQALNPDTEKIDPALLKVNVTANRLPAIDPTGHHPNG